MPRIQILLTTLALLILAMAALPSDAQTLTVTLSGNSVNFPLTAGSASNPGDATITATTRITCFFCFRTVHVYAYFANAASALTQPGADIPSSAFQISTGAGFQALTNNIPAFGVAGAGLELSNFNSGFFGATHNDVMDFNIDLSTLPNLAPGTYTGTLTIRAQAP